MDINSKRLKMSQITQNDWALFERLHTEPQIISKCFDKPGPAELKTKFKITRAISSFLLMRSTMSERTWTAF